MVREPVTPNRLLVGLCAYFAVLLGGIVAVTLTNPELLPLLPLGGNDVLQMAGMEASAQSLFDYLEPSDQTIEPPVSSRQVGLLALFLGFSLGGTILVMLPVTWTYAAIRREAGYRKSFPRALIVLPIIAATTVLLIQNNLALAFGLAAMVAAVRFRVALQEAIDGIFIFAAICVGLAAGIGHLGAATVMTLFFCVANAVLWKIDFGRNPVDDVKAEKKRAKLKSAPVSSETP